MTTTTRPRLLSVNGECPDRNVRNVNSCIPAAWSIAYKTARMFPFVDPEELAADLMVAVVRAANGFRPGLGWKFSTYAFTAMHRDLPRLIEKARHRGMRLVPPGSDGPAVHSMETRDKFGDRLGDSIPCPRQEPTESDRYGPLRRALARLDDRSRRIVEECVMGGRSYVEVGREAGMCKERCRQITQKALKILRQEMGVKA